MTASNSSPSQSWFDFAPQVAQDAELVQQLGFVPGLKEVLMLRQVHALEHATVWVLSESMQRSMPGVQAEQADAMLSGMSTDRGFYLYGQVNSQDLQRAVQVALNRLVRGEWNLAVHPRCGTNLSVGMLLTATLALGIHLVLPKDPISQLVGLGVAATTAVQVAPDLGEMAQRYVTTSIPFNLAVETISSSLDRWGRPVHFVQVRWVDSLKR